MYNIYTKQYSDLRIIALLYTETLFYNDSLTTSLYRGHLSVQAHDLSSSHPLYNITLYTFHFLTGTAGKGKSTASAFVWSLSVVCITVLGDLIRQASDFKAGIISSPVPCSFFNQLTAHSSCPETICAFIGFVGSLCPCLGQTSWILCARLAGYPMWSNW